MVDSKLKFITKPKFQSLSMEFQFFGMSLPKFIELKLHFGLIDPYIGSLMLTVATPFWDKCEDETHTPESGKLESFETLKNSELDRRGQNTLHWGVLYINEKVLKCRCQKWPRMSHLDICSPSYGQKKGWESNWQFDSRPLKVGNRSDFDVCR
jgi:hypothetical protein